MHRKLPLLICFALGTFMLVQFFVPHKASTALYEAILDWVQIIYAFSLLVGAMMLIKHHAVIASGRDAKERPFSILILMGITVMLVAGLFFGRGEGTVFHWVFQNVQAPMQATMFSLLSFFVASAAYRGLGPQQPGDILAGGGDYSDVGKNSSGRNNIFIYPQSGRLDSQCAFDGGPSGNIYRDCPGDYRHFATGDTGN